MSDEKSHKEISREEKKKKKTETKTMPKNRENRDYKRERENFKLLERKTVLYNDTLEITTSLASEKNPHFIMTWFFWVRSPSIA